MRLASLVVAFALIGVLHLLLARWRWGKAIRATAEDWQAALLPASTCAGRTCWPSPSARAWPAPPARLVTVGYSVSPSIGLEWTLKALIVVVLAGLGSMFGTFVGGLVLGVAEAASAAGFGGPYREVVGPGDLRGRARRPPARPVRPVSELDRAVTSGRWAAAILAALGPAGPAAAARCRRDDVLNFVFLILLSITLAQSWNIVAGYAGQVNLGPRGLLRPGRAGGAHAVDRRHADRRWPWPPAPWSPRCSRC